MKPNGIMLCVGIVLAIAVAYIMMMLPASPEKDLLLILSESIMISFGYLSFTVEGVKGHV